MISKPNLCNMKQCWEILPFEDCIVKVKYTTKIPNNDYLKQGLYPIISQEEGLVSGYWNNVVDVFKIVTPVVIFGDHTRILKYVDFDFVLGADGVKILQPIKRINAKFFKLYLESCKIPSLGYSRHYKLLKELQVPVPPLAEQERIVAELDSLSGVIEKKKQQLKELDALAQSIFYEMFGDPITNEKGWEVKKLGDISLIGTGATPSRGNEGLYYDGNIPWVKTTEVQNCEIINTEECITQQAIEETNCKVYPPGTILMAMYGQGKTRGQIAKLKINAATNQACAAIMLNEEMSNMNFVYELLLINYTNIRALARGGNQANLNLKLVSSIPIILPPLSLQQTFASKIEAIEKQKELIKQSIKEVETLFNSRMDYYFN